MCLQREHFNDVTFFGLLSLGCPSHSSPVTNMINIINLSWVLSIFLETLELTWLTLLTFPLFFKYILISRLFLFDTSKEKKREGERERERESSDGKTVEGWVWVFWGWWGVGGGGEGLGGDVCVGGGGFGCCAIGDSQDRLANHPPTCLLTETTLLSGSTRQPVFLPRQLGSQDRLANQPSHRDNLALRID